MLLPFSSKANLDIVFPKDSFLDLLTDFGWQDYSEWLNYWSSKNIENLITQHWAVGTKSDWFWGLGLPFLTQVEDILSKSESPFCIGISGLPGCGKSSFGKWLESAGNQIGVPILVISLDDFYFPSPELDEAMSDNPWNVPRALPGSHSIELLQRTIDNFLQTGELYAPCFNKSLRQGKGDRSGWRKGFAKVLVLEGWFLGCGSFGIDIVQDHNKSELIPPINKLELDYRSKVQEALKIYEPVWAKLIKVWHLKAVEFIYTAQWKREQELNMLSETGSSLTGKSLDNFIRMILTSIPQQHLNSISSNVRADITSTRRISWVGRNNSSFSNL